ncbi:unnamed protein product [Phytophthora lilii]|uniref:Unnamed protein product n=1 Tax=Phytophthora lilii TaxID=2077276 RepID=A0A9W6WYI5_9STRA|nr:unnamed protein product [Phytophthora lilii]
MSYYLRLTVQYKATAISTRALAVPIQLDQASRRHVQTILAVFSYSIIQNLTRTRPSRNDSLPHTTQTPQLEEAATASFTQEQAREHQKNVYPRDRGGVFLGLAGERVDKLVALIDAATTSIDVGSSAVNQDDVGRALVAAFDRHVPIRLFTHLRRVRPEPKWIQRFIERGIPVRHAEWTEDKSCQSTWTRTTVFPSSASSTTKL